MGAFALFKRDLYDWVSAQFGLWVHIKISYGSRMAPLSDIFGSCKCEQEKVGFSQKRLVSSASYDYTP